MYAGLERKKALVTGSGRGLGKACCLALAREGACVAVADLYNAEETAQEIEKLGAKAMAFHANVLKEAEVTGMVDRMVTEWGGIDVLVNNVWGGRPCLVAGRHASRRMGLDDGHQSKRALQLH
ncbi:MAG: SDR family NAD(P)-dependent oxidoreductase, partial [Dehalococcoidales bacterium]|nr:SDR family NAD(P)-dependent oxidoreductase [Dehalococcoidales bacterium]